MTELNTKHRISETHDRGEKNIRHPNKRNKG